MAIPAVVPPAAVCPENTNQKDTGSRNQGRFVHCRCQKGSGPKSPSSRNEDWRRQESIDVRRHWPSLRAYWSIAFFHLEPRKNFGAGGGNRTRVASLEDWNSTIELRPQRISSYGRLLPCQFTCVY